MVYNSCTGPNIKILRKIVHNQILSPNNSLFQHNNCFLVQSDPTPDQPVQPIAPFIVILVSAISSLRLFILPDNPYASPPPTRPQDPPRNARTAHRRALQPPNTQLVPTLRDADG